MNLWGNRLGQLLIIAVALFFFSCEEENNLLGYRNPTSKFKSFSIEIPLETSVMLLDSVRSNNSSGEVARLLVGEINDVNLGNVASTGIVQYFGFSADTVWTNPTLDSVKMYMPYDGYYYGDNTQKDVVLTAYKVETKLDYLRRRNYISRTEVAIGEEIGSVTQNIKPDSLASAKFDTVAIPLSESFSNELWKVVTDYKENKNKIYTSVEDFTDLFKGIAVKGSADNRMALGFKPFGVSIVMYYHTPKKNNLSVTFKTRNETATSVQSLVTYSHIVGDRSASPLAGLTSVMQEYDPGDGNRYIQAGTGIVTKVNFSRFYDFVDTLDSNVIINEAEFSITGVQANPTGQKVPNGLTVRFIKPDPYQGWKQWSIYPRYQVDSLKLAKFSGFIIRDQTVTTGSGVISALVDNTYVATMATDLISSSTTATLLQSSKTLLKYNTTSNAYFGYPTLFFQQAILESNRNFREFTDVILYPVLTKTMSGTDLDGSASAKSINKVVFPADKIKLIIKYTKPTVQD